MMRAYTIVFTNCQVRVRGIFLSGKFCAIPHPTHAPQAPSFRSTKILRYAIHAQYNYRGRVRPASVLICGQNSILGGLEARRARSLCLGEWLWGWSVGALLGAFSVLIIRVSEKTTPMEVEARVVYSMWGYTKAPIVVEHPAGIEPASSAWRAEILTIE